MKQPHRLGATSPNAEPDATRLMLNVLWLIRLRWVAVFGQLATISFTALVLEVRLWLAPLLAIVSLTAITNIAATFGLRSALARYPAPTVWRASRWATAMVMLLDLISLTGLLYFAGGPTNPFALFYFVNVALAAVLLPARSGWLLTAVALGCLAMLFFGHVQVAELSAPAVEDGAAHLRRWGFLAANVVAACVVTYFITRVTGELRQRELELRDAARREARSQRLQSLATLAAGAGHELATPLSTIAVVANELSKHLQGAKVPGEVLDDVSLIRSEVTRCRAILNRMSASAGQAAGEAVTALAPQAIVDEVLRGLRTTDRVCVTIDRSALDTRLTAPLEGLAQAIRGLVQNALDATEPEGQVELRVSMTDSPAAVRFEVRDRGPGMSEDILHRAGEPFFTTKEPGQGMGLGLFLTRSVVERLGGKMTLESSQYVLTLAIVELPLRAP
jgi:two-component system sensor histidine kinase RegB